MYATVEDVEKRCRRTLTDAEKDTCSVLLEDAAVLLDSYNINASADAKKVVSCNTVVRALGADDSTSVPIGASQGTVSALGYSQTWTMAGTSGELYLSKTDKQLLGVGNRVGFSNYLGDST